MYNITTIKKTREKKEKYTPIENWRNHGFCFLRLHCVPCWSAFHWLNRRVKNKKQKVGQMKLIYDDENGEKESRVSTNNSP